jgi:hypothetical protein
MKLHIAAPLALAFTASLSAQLIPFTLEQMVASTADNPYERFQDGRPNVPDKLLEKLRGCSLEEVWAVMEQHGYTHQYEAKWQIAHPDRRLVGRAVTAQYAGEAGCVSFYRGAE